MKYVVIFLCVIFTGCHPCHHIFKKFYYTDYGGLRPKKNDFFYGRTPYHLKPNDKIKTDNIYYSNIFFQDYCLTSFFLFFENGRVLQGSYSNHDRTLVLQSKHLLKQGRIGYYKIEKDTLFVEIFDVRYGGIGNSNCGKNERYKFEITDKGIKEIAIRDRQNNWYIYEEPEFYKKEYFNRPIEYPDW